MDAGYDKKKGSECVNFIQELLGNLNTFLYSNILIILLVAAGLYFSIRTGFVQFRMLGEGLRLLGEKAHHHDGVSSFQALMISTASRVGTGNIAGVATALAAGGAGSIFWMWVIALIGGASAFVESTLAQIYKERDGDQFRGGPAYYIEKALHKRWLGILFAVLLIACFIFGFNGLQAYNVSSALEYYVTDTQTASMLVGLVLAGATAAVIFGGFAGSCVMYGIKRGLFSNEAGMGSAPNAGATADVSHPVKQGLVQTISVFIDTILICSTTAFMLLNFGIRDGLTGMPYVQTAVSAEVGTWGIHFITISIILFAFSSLIGNYCYAESNLKFIINDKKALLVFRLLTVAVIFFGAQADFSTIWDLADVLMGFMAIENILVILLLGNVAFLALKDYTKQKKQGKDPLFEPQKLGIRHAECWEGIDEEYKES